MHHYRMLIDGELCNSARGDLLKATGHPGRQSETTVPREDLAACADAAFIDPANLANGRHVGSPAEIEALYEAAW